MQSLNWFKVSDGTPATDMSVAMVSQPLATTQLKISFQFWWPATGSPTGNLGFQESSDQSHWDTASLGSADQGPTQPAGTASSTTIDISEFPATFARATYTPTSGGTGAVLGGNFTAK